MEEKFSYYLNVLRFKKIISLMNCMKYGVQLTWTSVSPTELDFCKSNWEKKTVYIISFDFLEEHFSYYFNVL